MESVYEMLNKLMSPEHLIYYGGVSLILFIIFAENGIFLCFFFPGDTLLFTTGILCSTGFIQTHILLLAFLIWLAAILGNLTGYLFGRKAGEKLFKRNDTLLFKKKYVYSAQHFFTKYGGMALILGRFLPIIRTFSPILAGIAKFDIKKLMLFNILGGTLWVFSMLFAGYFIAELFPPIKDYLEFFIIGIIIITWIPVIRTYLKERKKHNLAIVEKENSRRNNLG